MRKEPSQLGAHGAGGFEDGDMKSILKPILDPIWNGVNVDLGSIWFPFGINLGAILEAIWGPFGVHFGVNLGPCRNVAGTRASDPLGTRFLTHWTDLGASLEPHVGPMLAVVGRLGPSWSVLGAI